MAGTFTSLKRYVPDFLADRMRDRTEPLREPEMHDFPAAVLFADISGFTALTEKLTRNNPEGADQLVGILDRYLGRAIDIISDWGGDIFKFAGDALFAVWKVEAHENLAEQTLLAVRCALTVQKTLHKFEPAPGVYLSIKMSMSAGQIRALLVGGTFDRWEPVIMGEPMNQVGKGEKSAHPGEIVIGPRAWKLLRNAGFGFVNGSGKFRIPTFAPTPPPLPPTETRPVSAAGEKILLNLIPRAILAQVNEEAHVSSGLHHISVIFMNIRGLSPDTPLAEMQALMSLMQNCMYRYHGSINRFGVDDKGAVLLAGFGLPPFRSSDDPERAVQAALDLRAALKKAGRETSIGITTGKVFCGPVGNARRSEYTVHGSRVNLAARLMQAAETILCDAATYITATSLQFEILPVLHVKGRDEPVEVFRPIHS